MLVDRVDVFGRTSGVARSIVRLRVKEPRAHLIGRLGQGESVLNELLVDARGAVIP